MDTNDKEILLRIDRQYGREEAFAHVNELLKKTFLELGKTKSELYEAQDLVITIKKEKKALENVLREKNIKIRELKFNNKNKLF